LPPSAATTGGSVGVTETKRVVLYTEDDPLVLDSGATLAPVEVAYETYGELDADASNAVVVCHALTGDAHAAGHHGDPTKRGWWDNLIGPGKPIDTNRFFIVSSNLLGGCKGTTGPSSTDPTTGRPYGLRFPLLTVADLVKPQRALLAHLGIDRPAAAIGGSLGGMQILQWALDPPRRARRRHPRLRLVAALGTEHRLLSRRTRVDHARRALLRRRLLRNRT